jgi:ATP synthase assembly factor FMC1, mitochondrial
MASTSAQARSLYRSILRELPHRPVSNPSPLKNHIRSTFLGFSTSSEKLAQQQLDEASQFIQYAKSQRMYATLLERYNPGMSMDEEERVRLTMRRVGMDAPSQWKPDQS